VIMPTSFSRVSTPQFHALWPDLKRARAAQAADIAQGFGQLANAINPFPCTEVDADGNLVPAINFGSCALPLALHAYAIHSAREPGLPGESQAPPAKTETVKTETAKKTELVKTQPVKTESKPATTESKAAETEPAKTEPKPAKTAPAKTEPKPAKTAPAKKESAKTEPKRAAVRSPAELERYLEQQGLTSNQIRGLDKGSQARAALIERLLGHFTAADLKALGTFLREEKITLDVDAVDALIEGIPPGGVSDWIKTKSIAEMHGEATRLPSVERAREESLGEEQDPRGRMKVAKEKKPSPGPEPRAFLRGNFAHRFAEHLLDAARLPRPSRAEVVIELRDGTGDIIRTDRIISHADHGELLEIKPAGRSAAIGEAQLPGRLEALQREFPKKNGWNGRIVEYTADDVRAWLRAEAQAAQAGGRPPPDVDGIMKLFGF
jgi:hypothetical protein